MTVLSEMPSGMGGKWILVKYTDTFYGYGKSEDFKCTSELPVNRCGTKEEVLENFLRMIKISKEYIQRYQKELAKEKKNPEVWKMMIASEQKAVEMYTEFARILKEME